MKIKYVNMPQGSGRFNFFLRYCFNILRTWYFFHIKYPHVKYKGFVRIKPHTTFAKRNISMGHHVQFGSYCNISVDTNFGNNILLAERVCIIGRIDHTFDIPEQFI